MIRRPLISTAALLALLSIPRLGLAGERAPDAKAPLHDLVLRADAGWFDGLGVRRASGPVAIFGGAYTPRLEAGSWKIAFPLRLEHRQTFGENLDETIAAVTIDAATRAGRVEHGPIAGASYTWRPDWPDLYQPECGGGSLCPTDRYSHSRLWAGWQLWSRLGGGRHLRGNVKVGRTNYPNDPNYDPNASVVHLAPGTHTEVSGKLQYRQLAGPFAWLLRVDARYRKYTNLIAKNAYTGGTFRPNPDQALARAEPRGELQLRTKRVDASVGWTLLAQSDRFEGYYSYMGHEPYAELRVAVTRALSLEGRAGARWIRYGPNSKSLTADGAGGFIPGTEDGKRYQTSVYALRGGLRWALPHDLTLVGDVEWKRRDSNFIDYVPGVYPPTATTRLYDIRWDYTNTLVTAGLEWRP